MDQSTIPPAVDARPHGGLRSLLAKWAPSRREGMVENRPFLDFLTPEFDQRFGLNGAGDGVREQFPVHSEGLAARDAGLIGGAQEERVQSAQFPLQQPWGGVLLLALERVGADEFG